MSYDLWEQLREEKEVMTGSFNDLGWW